MRQVAPEAFQTDATLDAVQVYEHGGLYLTFLRAGTVFGTANDQADLSEKAVKFLRSIRDYTLPENFAVPSIIPATDTAYAGGGKLFITRSTNFGQR
jgi:hypothetical protein